MTFAEQLVCGSPVQSGGDSEEMCEALVPTVTAQQAQPENQRVDRQGNLNRKSTVETVAQPWARKSLPGSRALLLQLSDREKSSMRW